MLEVGLDQRRHGAAEAFVESKKKSVGGYPRKHRRIFLSFFKTANERRTRKMTKG